MLVEIRLCEAQASLRIEEKLTLVLKSRVKRARGDGLDTTLIHDRVVWARDLEVLQEQERARLGQPPGYAIPGFSTLAARQRADRGH